MDEDTAPTAAEARAYVAARPGCAARVAELAAWVEDNPPPDHVIDVLRRVLPPVYPAPRL